MNVTTKQKTGQTYKITSNKPIRKNIQCVMVTAGTGYMMKTALTVKSVKNNYCVQFAPEQILWRIFAGAVLEKIWKLTVEKNQQNQMSRMRPTVHLNVLLKSVILF